MFKIKLKITKIIKGGIKYMPNWCFNTIRIIGPNKESTEKFFKLLSDWKTEDNWLGNIVEKSGIDDKKHEKYSCRGSISYLDYDECDQISIDTETAWGPTNEMWYALIEKYLPDGEFFYTSEEPGCGVYETNEPDLLDKYIYDAWGDTSDLTEEEAKRYKEAKADESCWEMSYKDLEELITTLIPVNSKPEDEEELLNLWENSNFSSTASIHKWEAA